MANYWSNAGQDLEQQGLTQGNALGAQGLGMFNTLGGQAGYDQGLAQNYQGVADQAWGVGQGGPGGFSDSQTQGILGLNSQGNGLAGVSPLSDGGASWQLTPAQQAASMGNANGVAQGVQANNDQLGTYMMNNSAALQGATSSGQSSLSGAVDPSAFQLDPAYKASLANALGTEQGSLNSAANNPNLGLSNNFSQNYNFSPQDQQNIVNSAGLAAGDTYQAMSDQVARQAQASGNSSPLAIAAAQQNMARQGANATSQAMLNAQIQAKQQQLGVTQTAEQMRLGSAQDVSSRQLQAGESLAGTQIGAANTQQQLALQGATAGQGLGLQAATTGANLGLTGAQDVANLQSQNTQFATTANMQAGQYADTANANRAYQLGTNQQQTSELGQNTAYTQGMGVNNAMSGRQTTVANQQQQNQAAYRAAQTGNQQYYAGQTGSTLGQMNTAYGNQNSNYGQTYSLAQNAQKNAYGMQSPDLWSKLVGAASGAASGAAGALGG